MGWLGPSFIWLVTILGMGAVSPGDGNHHGDIMYYLCLRVRHEFTNSNFFLRKRLLTGTLPVNNSFLTRIVPAKKSLLTGTVPVNNSLLTGTLSVNKS